MSTISLRATRRRTGLRAVVAGLVAAVAVTGLSAPAQAADPRPETGDGAATITSALTVAPGATVSFEGTGFALGGTVEEPVGQVVSLKLDDAGDVLATATVQPDGSFAGTVKLAGDIANGEHWFRFLGSAPVVSKHSQKFTVDSTLSGVPAVSATATSSGTQVSVAVAGTGFVAGETLTATVDGAAATWTLGSGGSATTGPAATVAADGSLSSARLVFAAGSLRAGDHELVLTRSTAGTSPVEVAFTANPTIAFSALTRGSEGTLTLGLLPAGATISAVSFAGGTFAVPATATADGVATISYAIPANATLGSQTATITQTGPAATHTATAKVSPSAEIFGDDAFTRVETATGAIEQGLYQSAYSAKNDALFVTTANRTATSTLYRLDPETLAVEDSVVPAEETADALWAAYGVGVDDTKGTVWVTNTRQNTVAVYRQSDLSLVKQFPRNTSTHARDVVVDEDGGKAYVSQALRGGAANFIDVFDTTTLELVDQIPIAGTPMSLALDAADGKLYTVDIAAPKAYAIDLDSSAHTTETITLDLSANASASGVDYDPETNRLFVASQGDDNLLVVDATTGAELADVATGAGALNVQHDAVNDLTYVANFGGTTLTVVDDAYEVVANVDFSRTNHLEVDGKGSVFAVNKATDNQVLKLTPKAVTAGTVKVAGTAKVGSTLTAQPGTWTTGAKLSYQWLRGGVAISGAKAKTYAATAADAGKSVSVKVTGVKAPLSTASATSAAVKVASGTLKSATPKISGKAKVGKKLAAKPGAWTSGTKLKYRWYVGGKSVKGATKSSFKVTRKYVGKKVTVKVTGSKAGYATVTRTSAKTAKVKR